MSQGSAVTSYVRHQETCLHTLKSHFSLPVPLTATPGFITDIGKVFYVLLLKKAKLFLRVFDQVRLNSDSSVIKTTSFGICDVESRGIILPLQQTSNVQITLLTYTG